MANIAAVYVHGDKYQDLEELIQDVVPDFIFQNDKTYIIQVFGGGKVCVKDDEPTSIEDFAYPYPFNYKHQNGSRIYVLGGSTHSARKILVNVSD